MKKLKAILFDMDGTIIHSLNIWESVIKKVIGEENVDQFKQAQEYIPGKGIQQTRRILNEIFAKTNDEIASKFAYHADAMLSNTDIKFIDGFEEFHQHLIKNSVIPCLVTNAPNYALNAVKKKINLSSLFGTHIYNPCSVNNTFKPNPTLFLHALKKLNICSKNTIIFEDSYEGIAAARQAGVSCIGVNSRNNIEELINSDFIINNYKNLTLEKISQLYAD